MKQKQSQKKIYKITTYSKKGKTSYRSIIQFFKWVNSQVLRKDMSLDIFW